MKRKQDGWHKIHRSNGKIETCFFYMGRIARHTPENDSEFQYKVDYLVEKLGTDLRKGKLKKDGKPYAHSVLSRWLCDICNHVYSGSWSSHDISEGHLNLVARELGWPEVWKKGGDVMYCVDCGDYMQMVVAIDSGRYDYPKYRSSNTLLRNR